MKIMGIFAAVIGAMAAIGGIVVFIVMMIEDRKSITKTDKNGHIVWKREHLKGNKEEKTEVI